MLDSTANAFAPEALRLPPVIFLITTAGRIARPAALFVGSTSFLCRNVVRLLRCFFNRLPRRVASASGQIPFAQIFQLLLVLFDPLRVLRRLTV